MPRILAEIRPTIALALPITIGQLSQMLMTVADSIMVGHVGTVPLAGSAFAGSVFSFFYVVGIGLMLPVSVFVAHARGAGKTTEAGEYLRHGLAMAFGYGVLETIAIAAIGTQLHWFGQPPEVIAVVNPFFLLIGSSITPVLVYLALRQFAEAMGRPWVPTAIMLGSVGLNVFLNWVLIYGHLGSPALGLTGAGIATLGSRVIATVVLFEWIRRDPRLGQLLPRHWLAPLARSRIKEMLKLGLPASGMLGFECAAFTAAALMMGWLGAEPLAAHQIAISCVSTTFMFTLGISLAAGLRVSAAVGAGQHDRLRAIGDASLLIGALIATGFMVVYLVGGRVIAGWFVRDPIVVGIAAQLLLVAAIFQLFDGTQVIAAALLRGLKDVTIPTVITFVAYWIIAIGGGYLFGIRGGSGAVGIWTALAAGLGFAALFLTVRFRRYTKTG